ncbi:cytochrome P450 [Aspergillus neoniger CBS 115656]|uniref:Cytochrome P450 n=1 Tax=Aspergillus neoniger (strain CBS 115656) TaxID=1448310 RepID=A0A318Y6Y2_ASPNB|nr:cytochrome P450 [Aspergillus neoniger CBS 115656]PYH30046.1 cytochrome P450 [Aspergillus neoniger CBS 115656]
MALTSIWNNTGILGGVSGISLHHLLFRHGEWDTKSSNIVLSYLCATLIGAVYLLHSPITRNGLVLISAFDFFLLIGYHFLGILGSILVYRGLFHRLSRFPGPLGARLSTLYLTIQTCKRMKIHQDVHRLHQQYGDYVRVGPMEVSIIDLAALNPLYGNSSETAKGPWYILMEPLDGLVFTRDKKEHALRRKIVDQSLSSKALVTYEPVIAKCTEQLLQIIEDRSGNPINITEWLKRYSFEIMGHLIFGRPFNTISEEGGDTFLLDSIHSDMNMMGYLRHMPWIPALLIKTPLFRKKNTRFWTWLQTNFRQRTEVCTLPAAN